MPAFGLVRKGVPTDCLGEGEHQHRPTKVVTGMVSTGEKGRSVVEEEGATRDWRAFSTSQGLSSLPQQRGQTLWDEYHRQAGHANPDKTAALLRQRYFWPGMAKDRATWGQECRLCITNKPRPAVRAPLVSIQSSYPFQIVGIDYLSLGQSDNSHPYILVMTD